jgi:hypothetical protein
MHYFSVINAALSNENDRPMMQKELYPVRAALQEYLKTFSRDIPLPVRYTELMHYRYTNALKNEKGRHTHWERVIYPDEMLEDLHQRMCICWELLHPVAAGNLKVDRVLHIDFCEFANSMPFRVIVALEDGTQDYFYIKAADASRVYGLELEDLLTDNRQNYFCHDQTLIEDHIIGVPGDDFIKQHPSLNEGQIQQLAKAFVQFGERCFMRLLGDMRSYNFVVIELDGAYQLRPIDFDQQCYEGRLKLYLPQFYKENLDWLGFVKQYWLPEQVTQIQIGEKERMQVLYQFKKAQIHDLLNILSGDTISENYKFLQLRADLNEWHQGQQFASCNTMGGLVKQQLVTCLM